MNRSQIFILINLFLLITGGTTFYLATGKFRVNDQVKLVNIDKESKFRQEVTVLDSLYRQYVYAMKAGDPMLLASSNAQYQRQIALIQEEYTGTAAPAVLSSKLIRNYQVRVILNEHSQKRKEILAGEVNKLKSVIAKLEEQRVELKSKNDMIKQALLALP